MPISMVCMKKKKTVEKFVRNVQHKVVATPDERTGEHD